MACGINQIFLTAVAQPEEALTTDLPRKHALPAGAGPPPKRSKKGKKAKGGTSTLIPELNPSDYVRVVKVTNKEDLLHEGPVLLSKVDKAGQMTLDQDRLSVTSSKGYRMVTSDQSSLLVLQHAASAYLTHSACARSIGSRDTWCVSRHMVF